MIKFNVLADDIYLAPSAIDQHDLLGAWVEVADSPAEVKHGFVLITGGIARSVNNESRVYLEWEFNGSNLILHGNDVGNGNREEFVEILLVDVLGKNELRVYGNNGNLRIFKRTSTVD